MQNKTVSIVGCGGRGLETYAKFLQDYDNVKITDVCDLDVTKENRLSFIIKNDVNFFDNEEDFFKVKRTDAIIIANLDEDHFKTVMKAIELKYDILLEKPITKDMNELKEIKLAADQNGVRIMVCHVLRYTPFFSKVKEIVDSGELGKMIGIDLVENIGNYHFAHSYVRGNWKDETISTPLIFAKSCHDLDILAWLIKSDLKNVYAQGDLNYFTKENKPVNSSDRCYNCPIKADCIYNAEKVYTKYKDKWPTNVFTYSKDDEEIKEILKTSQYGRCVWDSDNSTQDHITSIMNFENNVNCTFTVTAFSQVQERRLKIYGTHMTLEADLSTNTIKLVPFIFGGKDEFTSSIITPELIIGGHNGGDQKIIADFVKFISDKNHIPRTNLDESIQSHLMADAIMDSMKNKKLVEL